MSGGKLLIALGAVVVFAIAGWVAREAARPRILPAKHADAVRNGVSLSGAAATATTPANVTSATSGAEAGEGLFGPATVIDGDTLMITEVEVDLWNVDAPELDQPCEKDGKPWACGEASRQQLARMVEGGRVVACRRSGPPSEEGRWVGMCFVSDIACADSEDACEGSLGSLNLAMVRQGWAFDPESEFNDDEADAEEEKLGVWAGKVERPWQWRERRAEPTVAR